MGSTQTVLITGGSQGFGRLTAEALARKGHTVYASMRAVDGKNAEVAHELRKLAADDGLDLHVVEIDVTSDASVDAGVSAVVDQAGAIDVLINNAGIGTFGMAETFTVEQVQTVFDVNVTGVLRMNRAVLPAMRARNSGLVIYVSSGLGRILFPFVGVYAGSKWALEALAEVSNYELAPLGIDTVIVQPGAYGTGFGANMIPAADRERAAGYGPVLEMLNAMMERFSESTSYGDPSEVADAIVELVEMPAGERPLRRPVGADVEQAVGAINAVAADVQQQIMQNMGG